MLKVIAGDFEYRPFNGLIQSSTGKFFNNWKKEWFTSDFGKRLLAEEKIVGIQNGYFVHECGSLVRVDEISHGAKGIFTMKYAYDSRRVYDAKYIGSNLYKFVIEIAREKDVYLMIDSVYLYDENISGVFLNNGQYFRNDGELDKLVLKYKFCCLENTDVDGVLLAREYNSCISSEIVYTGKEYKIKLWYGFMDSRR